MDSIWASGIYTMIDQIKDSIQNESYSDLAKQRLKEKLREELLQAAQNDSSIPEELKDFLLFVVHSVAETIVESPLTNLPKLELLLNIQSDLSKGFFARLLQTVMAFFKNIYTRMFTHNLDVPIEQRESLCHRPVE